MIQFPLVRAVAAFLILSFLGLTAAIADMQFKRAALTIQTQQGPVELNVEIADTEPKRERGLMFRRSLAPNSGMIFLFDGPERIQMWMKNTYIPLDMVFIGDDWRISSIARNAEPHSEDIIASEGLASRVLEIGGGQAEALGLHTGDKLTLHR